MRFAAVKRFCCAGILNSFVKCYCYKLLSWCGTLEAFDSKLRASRCTLRVDKKCRDVTAARSSCVVRVFWVHEERRCWSPSSLAPVCACRLSVLFSQSGQVVNSSIDGCIQMKSYLSGELFGSSDALGVSRSSRDRVCCRAGLGRTTASLER